MMVKQNILITISKSISQILEVANIPDSTLLGKNVLCLSHH